MKSCHDLSPLRNHKLHLPVHLASFCGVVVCYGIGFAVSFVSNFLRLQFFRH